MRLRRSASLMAKDPYTLVIALDKNKEAEGSLYMDDEVSLSYKLSQSYLLAKVTFKDNVLANSLAFGATSDSQVAGDVERVVILGLDQKPSSVTAADGSALEMDYQADADTLTIRKPGVSMSSEWRISIAV
eukprot:scaffold109_cov252-Pinguiococcus_pyrenoidosus.AAC.38